MSLAKYRRGLIRPLTEEAEEVLREGGVPLAEDLEYSPIPDAIYEKQFQLFNDLDRICGVAADDFEAEEVEPERLECVCRTLKTYPRRDTAGKLDVELDDILDRMWGLCFRAKTAGRAVFFVL